MHEVSFKRGAAGMAETSNWAANCAAGSAEQPYAGAWEDVSKASGGGTPPAKAEKNDDLEAFPACLKTRYQCLKRLGAGSQGEVYHARRISDGADVAVKVMHIQSVKNWKMYELFDRESRVLQTLDIDGVSHFYEAVEDLNSADPISAIVQEFINGYALSSYIAAGHRFLIDDIAEILLQLVEILDKLHRHDPPVIHRDVKPSNIMLEPLESGFKVWLIDFGAVANPQVKDGGSTVAGTYGYMAPEQLMGQASPGSDMYSVGVLAFYLLSGVPPEAVEMHDFRLLIDPHLQNLPFSVTVLLRKMLEPRSADRLSSPELLKRAFRAIKANRFDALNRIVCGDAARELVEPTPIYSYKQSGCVEQWDALSDTLPRSINLIDEMRFQRGLKMISSNYYDVISENNEEYTEVFRWKTDGFDKIATPEMQLWTTLPKTGGRWIFDCVNRIIVSRVRYHDVPAAKLSACVLIVAFLIIAGAFLFRWGVIIEILLMGIVFAFMFLRLKFNVHLRTGVLGYIWDAVSLRRRSGSRDDSTQTLWHRVYPLFAFGRKTLATVKNIEYLIPQELYQRPLWRITYAFNPVDDSSPDDLTRTFCTRVPPDDLKCGDLIPCLYVIGKTEDGEEYVYSTPWPILALDDIYCVADICKLMMRNDVLTARHIKNIQSNEEFGVVSYGG